LIDFQAYLEPKLWAKNHKLVKLSTQIGKTFYTHKR